MCLQATLQRSPTIPLLTTMAEQRRPDPQLRRAGTKLEEDGVYVEGCVLNNNTIRLFEYVVDSERKTTYMKGKFLGKGGFAWVHELTDLNVNKVYAGKIIPKSRLTKPHQKEKILKEIDLHRTLKHKNIVQFHNYFEDKDNVYIVMEYCARKSMVHLLKNRKMLTEPEVRYFLHQLAQGVQYMHGQNVIHRDLKLGNLFLSDRLELKIGDFGLATYMKDGGCGTTTVCGTPNYIAPEVLNVQGHGFAADIWAMGCIMYAMMFGQPPFETSTINETYDRISNSKYSIPEGVSEAGRDLITRMLQRNPDDRPKVDEILQDDFFTSTQIPSSLCPPPCGVASRQPGEIRNSGATVDDSVDVKNVECSLFALNVDHDKSYKSEKSKKRSFHFSLKRKLLSIFTRNKGSKLKEYSSKTLLELLSSCAKSMPKEKTAALSPLASSTLLFITKWIDYSNKYGFGYQLSDRSVGVVFNDGTRLSLSPDKTYVEFWPLEGKMATHHTSNIPADLCMRYTLLQYFSQYMKENLTDGGDLHGGKLVKPKSAIPYVKRWIRTSTEIVIQLNSGTLQINFASDHTKLILSGTCQGLLMFIDKDRCAKTYTLKDISKKGCDATIGGHIQYALSVLQDLVETECD